MKSPTIPAVQGAQRPVSRGHCHNCGAAASGKFCPECGQETTLHVASAREFLHEFIGHYVALEGKLWRTLALLVFRPGKLSAEYIAGRRARYVQPLRIYLTLSILFFALLKYGPAELIKADPPAVATAQVAPAADEVHVSTRMGTINPAWEAKILKLGAMPHEQRLALIKTTFFAYVPYAMFCIMPLFALYLKLLYLRSGRRYGEHMLFALHANAFAFLLLGLMWVIRGGWIDGALFAWLAVYLPVAMRRVYGGSKLATVARWFVLMAAYMMTVAAVVIGTVFTATVVL